MNIKTKLRSVLGELLIKAPVNSYRDRVTNKKAIENIIVNPSKLSGKILSQSPGGILRILASNDDNANEIARELNRSKDDLHIRSVHIFDEAIEYFSPKHQLPLYSRSVLVKLDPKYLLKSGISTMNPNNLTMLQKEITERGCEELKSEKVVIDFSSPNIAKPFHFGHLRSTIQGNYLANLNTFVGNQVMKLNYIGDWGTQYGLLSLGLEEFGFTESEGDNSSAIRKLLNIYVKANERGKSDQAFYKEAKRRFLKLDRGSKEIGADDDQHYQRWRQIRDLSLDELKVSYARLGIEFDTFEFESEYAGQAAALVSDIKSKKFVKELEDGVIVASLEKNYRVFDVPLQKSDGSSLYITRDVAAALSRKGKYNFDRMLYVVGADQEKHFHYLGELIKELGHDWHDRLVHVKMGKVLGMSSRSGNFELLSDIIDEATRRCVATTQNTPSTRVQLDDGEQLEETGLQLALTALFVFDMRNGRTRHYDFDWDQVAFSGNRSGISLQTTHAKLFSLLKRAKSDGLEPYSSNDNLYPDAICCEEAMNLLSLLCELDTVLHNSYWSMDASPLVNHALHLCRAINRARYSERLWVQGESNLDWAQTRLGLFETSYKQLGLLIKLIGLKPLDRV